MSELKWSWVYYPYLDAPNKQEESALKAGYIKVVIKDEADKVIAEKDKEIERLNDKALQYKVLDKEHCRDLNTQERRFALQMAHQKYKRCLAMAMWCCDACDKWMMRKAKAISLGKDGVKEYHQARSKLFHYMRWQTRWLKIAEKFKEAK